MSDDLKPPLDDLCRECGKLQGDDYHDTDNAVDAACSPESSVTDLMLFHSFVRATPNETSSAHDIDDEMVMRALRTFRKTEGTSFHAMQKALEAALSGEEPE